MNPEDARAYFEALPRNMVKNTMNIIDHEDTIHKLDPNHWDVLSLRTPSRRVRVYRRGDLIRCRVDKKNNQDQSCSHILAVMIYEALIEIPNTASQIWKKSNDGRNHSLEEEAWRALPEEVPRLLARLLREGLPVMEPPLDPLAVGRPRKPLYPLVYQAVTRVAWRQNLRSIHGAMDTATHREHNPYGGVGRSTLSRFLADPDTTQVLEKLLALTTWPAKPYETVVHPDGTGLTEQRFTAFFEEKHKKRGERREHSWNFAEILWTYRYTLVAAFYTQRGTFGEAPWLIPLLERAALMLDVGELGADKAYNAHYIDEYLDHHGIDAQIKLTKNANPTNRSAKNRAYKRTVEAARLDPEGYAAKAYRHSNAEAGNHVFKAFLGDAIYSRDPTAQRNEILCMCIAYNLARLVLLCIDQGIEIQFTGGAQVLASARWRSLDAVKRAALSARSKTQRLRA